MLDWLLNAGNFLKSLSFAEIAKLMIAGFAGLIAALIWSAWQHPTILLGLVNRNDPIATIATRQGDCYVYNRPLLQGSGKVLANYIPVEEQPYEMIIIALFTNGDIDQKILVDACKAMQSLEQQ